MPAVLPSIPDAQPLVLLDLLFKLKVKDVMTTDLITVRRSDPLRRAQAAMKDARITGVPVVEEGRLFGIVSMDDIINALETGRIGERVEQHMETRVVVLEEDMPLSFGVSYFDKYRFGRFPVLNRANRVVGIITSRDVSASLLLELYKEYHRLEEQMPHATAKTGPERVSMQFNVTQYDFENAGKSSHAIKKALVSRGADSGIIRRASIAAYEMEINMVVHSRGGRMQCSLDADRIEILATDRGPGIEDVDLALQEGWTTANAWIQSLGFGAGMGLGNIRRVSDEFDIRSGRGAPTIVKSVIFIRPPPVAVPPPGTSSP